VGVEVVTRLGASFHDAVMPRIQCQLWPISPWRQYRQEAGYPCGVEDTHGNAMPSVPAICMDLGVPEPATAEDVEKLCLREILEDSSFKKARADVQAGRMV